MRQTKSLVHFEILYVYSKVSFELWKKKIWAKSKFGVRTFFWLSVWEKTKSSFWRKAKSRCFGLVCFFKIIFRFSKRCSEGREQYFWDFWVRTEENKSMKEFACFSTTDVLYQLVNLVLKTCFIFSKTLKLGKTFCLKFLVSFDHSNNELWFPYSRFWNKNVQENVNSWVFGVIFTKSIVVSILDFWHISFRKMFKLLTCKRNHNFWVSVYVKRLRSLSWLVGLLTFSLSVFFWREKAPIELGAM